MAAKASGISTSATRNWFHSIHRMALATTMPATQQAAAHDGLAARVGLVVRPSSGVEIGGHAPAAAASGSGVAWPTTMMEYVVRNATPPRKNTDLKIW